MSEIQIRPVTNVIGAEIHGVNLSKPLDASLPRIFRLAENRVQSARAFRDQLPHLTIVQIEVLMQAALKVTDAVIGLAKCATQVIPRDPP